VVLRVDVDGHTPGILRPAREPGLDPDWFSRPAHVAFPTPAAVRCSTPVEVAGG
jgi:hypothetical protein